MPAPCGPRCSPVGPSRARSLLGRRRTLIPADTQLRDPAPSPVASASVGRAGPSRHRHRHRPRHRHEPGPGSRSGHLRRRGRRGRRLAAGTWPEDRRSADRSARDGARLAALASDPPHQPARRDWLPTPTTGHHLDRPERSDPSDTAGHVHRHPGSGRPPSNGPIRRRSPNCPNWYGPLRRNNRCEAVHHHQHGSGLWRRIWPVEHPHSRTGGPSSSTIKHQVSAGWAILVHVGDRCRRLNRPPPHDHVSAMPRPERDQAIARPGSHVTHSHGDELGWLPDDVPNWVHAILRSIGPG
jgi:hypothetical protein